MERNFIEDKTFTKTDFALNKPEPADYENCIFKSCNFASTDLSGLNFSECEFLECDLSLAKTIKTTFRDIQFKNCKLLGLHFENCNEFLFSAGFENCVLNLSSFYKLKLKNAKFKNTGLHEVDFTESDLSSSIFDNCDFSGAVFDRTILEKADFRTSYNYSIDPETNRIKKAKFSVSGLTGLLAKYDIDVE